MAQSIEKGELEIQNQAVVYSGMINLIKVFIASTALCGRRNGNVIWVNELMCSLSWNLDFSRSWMYYYSLIAFSFCVGVVCIL